MKFIQIKSSELKQITSFLTENQIIFHPIISPSGSPDFTNFENKTKILILDRNIIVPIIRLLKNGTLKDKFILKLIASLIFWADFNNIKLNSGLALTEYAFFKENNIDANFEQSILQELFNKYSPEKWLNLSLEKKYFLKTTESEAKSDINYFQESEHFKMHYLEMLKISQLYFNNKITILEKIERFHNWIYKNILICKYTTYFSVLVFGGNSKIFKNEDINFENILKICRNGAWDLTYLSIWSTFYYFEKDSREVYLFATRDKELKELIKLTHNESFEIYIKTFGKKLGKEIIEKIQKIYLPREKPKINIETLNHKINKEENNLRKILKNYAT